MGVNGNVVPIHLPACGFVDRSMSIHPVSWEIGAMLQQGMLLEVTTSNKPGLVCPNSNGCHQDMSLVTFMVGASVIFPALVMCAQAGRDHTGDLALLLPVIREIGAPYEMNLIAATKGVNTQKGILFSAAILAGAVGYLSRRTKVLEAEELFEIVAAIARGIVSSELNPLELQKKKSLTNGEKQYLKYRIPGIRGEVESGFSSVREQALPALEYAQDLGASLNDSCLHTLITLMSHTDDSNIVSRGGIESLSQVKELSGRILECGSIFKEEGLRRYYKLKFYCNQNHISPGGSADLLSITISIYLIINKEFKSLII